MKKFIPYEEKHLKEGVKVKLRNGAEGTISYIGEIIFYVNGVLTHIKDNGLCYYDNRGTNSFDVVEIEVEAKLPKAKRGDKFKTKMGSTYKITNLFPKEGIMLARRVDIPTDFHFIFKLDGTALDTDKELNEMMSSEVPFEV